MIDRQRFATIFGASILVLSLVAFGVPVPTIVDDGTPDTSESVDGIHPSYDIQMTTTDGYMTQDVEALACGGLCVAGVAVSAGVAGTVIGSGYFSSDTDSQSASWYSAQSLDDRIETDYKTLNSSTEEIRTMAYRVAESEFASSMANGSSKIEAQQQADKKVTKYLADVIEDEYVRRNNAYVANLYQMDNTSGVDVFEVDGPPSNISWQIYSASPAPRNLTATYLPAGTEYHSWLPLNPLDGSINFNTLSSTDVGFDSNEYSQRTIQLNQGSMASSYNDVLAIRSEVINELDSFASSVDESQYDNLSADEITSPITQALEFGESFNSTGSTGYANALAQSLGYNTSDLGTTYNLTLNGSQYEGTLYGDFTNITDGEVIDGANTTGWIATNSGGIVPINGRATVNGITLENGTAVNETQFSTWSRQELNSSAPTETLREWLNLQEEVGSGDGFFGGFLGGDGFLPFIPGGTAAHLLILAGGAFLLFGGSRGGGSTIVMGGGGSSGGQ